MGCGCSARRRASRAGEVTLGYEVTYPDGSMSSTFMSLVEARVEVRQAGGGTIRKVVKRA